jgi:hypothetical protein
MGFIRYQQERLAARLLRWQFEKNGEPVPDDNQLARRARIIVDDAHRIAKERGKNVMAILKDMVGDLRKR